MTDLLLHPLSEQHLQAFQRSPGQTLLLVGPAGSGKRSIAHWLAETILELPAGDFGNYAYGLTIKKGKTTSIGIESIRELEKFLSLQVPGHKRFTRAAIIEDSHLLTLEAQNALLKTLEEPPTATLIIMTAVQTQALLPTVRSRLSMINLRPPEKTAAEAYFGRQFDAGQVGRAYAISGGLPGLMQALLSETDHPLLAATQMARQLLSQNSYQRLLTVDELARQPVLTRDVLFILQQMAHISLQTASGQAANKWQAVLSASYQAAEALEKNAQPKLVLTNLMLSL